MTCGLLIPNWLMDSESVNQLQKGNMGIIYVILGVPAKQMVRIAISLTVAYNGYVEIWAREFGSVKFM